MVDCFLSVANLEDKKYCYATITVTPAAQINALPRHNLVESKPKDSDISWREYERVKDFSHNSAAELLYVARCCYLFSVLCRSATILKQLAGDENNTDRLLTAGCSAGKPRVLALV